MTTEKVLDRKDRNFLAQLTDSDVEGIAEDLGMVTGLTRTEVMNYARANAAGRDTQEVALQLGAMFRHALEDPELFGLSREALGTARVMLTQHDAEDRRRLAAKGWALPDGSYPIETITDANNAAILIRSRHGDWQAATKLLARRCREEGWRNPLDTDEIQGTWSTPVGLTANSDEAALVSHIEDTLDPVGAEVARICLAHGGRDGISLASPMGDSPELFGLSAGRAVIPGRPGGGSADEITARHPGMFGKGGNRAKPDGTTKPHRPGRGHVRTCPKDCTRDHNQPRRGNAMHPEAERLIKKHEGLGMFGRPDGQDRSAGNRTFEPADPAVQVRQRY
jgi:hypothetical protein